jgi:hypothetical protein
VSVLSRHTKFHLKFNRIASQYRDYQNIYAKLTAFDPQLTERLDRNSKWAESCVRFLRYRYMRSD